MGAVEKTLIPQNIAGSRGPETGTDVCRDNLLMQARRVELKEIRELLRLVPLLVLIPENSQQVEALQLRIAGNKTQTETGQAAKVLRIFGHAARESQPPNPETEFVFGEITVNFLEMVAHRKGQPVELTAMQFKTLKYFVRNPRRVISRDELLNEVWGYENYPCTRTVDNHILRLRQKLEKHPARPVHFRTVHGAGYKFLP